MDPLHCALVSGSSGVNTSSGIRSDDNVEVILEGVW